MSSVLKCGDSKPVCVWTDSLKPLKKSTILDTVSYFLAAFLSRHIKETHCCTEFIKHLMSILSRSHILHPAAVNTYKSTKCV